MKLRIDITGQTPLYLHNPAHLANPLDPLAQEIKKLTAKRNKTIDDHKRIAELEMKASLYYDKKEGVIIPTWNVKKCFIEAGRLRKFGKMVERGFVPFEPIVPLVYEGPDTPDDLWAEGFWRTDTMGQRGNRIARTRPFFEEWGVALDSELDTNQMNLTNLQQVTEDAGTLMGLGDSRNMGFGRFTVDIEEV